MGKIIKGILLWITAFAWIAFICGIDGMSFLFGLEFLFVNLILTIICIYIIDNFEELNKLLLNDYFEKLLNKK
jgi:hypothetical protein